MAHPREITFSVHAYDKDGDRTKSGVFLHFGETRVKAAESITDFAEIVKHFKEMLEEIAESNYRD